MNRVLLISNQFARSVSPRTREVIAKALSADCKLEAVETASRQHATELARDAVDRGFEAVVVFGGDGTINEAAQPLVNTDVALGVLPGGSTNVLARALGLPNDPVEATAVIGARLRTGSTRRIHVGSLGDRYFIFSAGFGFDGEVAREVEADLEKKRKLNHWFFLSKALTVAWKQYRGVEPTITLEVPGHEPRKVLLGICCNGRPYTYFNRFPVDVCPEAQLDGALDLFAMDRIRAGTIPRIAWGVLVSRTHVRFKHGHYFSGIDSARMTSTKPLPVQVDGDFIGERTEVAPTLVRNALNILV